MPNFTIETTYHLPVFRRRTYAADTLDAACRAAIDDYSWDIAEKDFDSSGPVHVTGIWDGAHAAYAGPPLQIPQQFEEPVQRRARHFEILLGLLKMLLDDISAARPPLPDWLARSAWAVARGEAILAGDPDPEEPVDLPKPSHVLVRLQEAGVRDAIAAVLEVDPSFRDLTRGRDRRRGPRRMCFHRHHDGFYRCGRKRRIPGGALGDPVGAQPANVRLILLLP